MKVSLTHSLLLLALTSLVSCGNKNNSVNLNVTSSFALSAAGYTGGLVITGKGPNNQTFTKSVIGGTSVSIALPDGSWEMSVVGWDGGVNPNGGFFTGKPACGKAVVTLASSDSTANVDITEANCRGADFSGGEFVDTTLGRIHPLRIVTCGSFYNHVGGTVLKIEQSNQSNIPSSFCQNTDHPADLRSRARSLKLNFLNKDLTGNFVPLENPVCLQIGNGLFNVPEQIPVKGFPVHISLYDDSQCSKMSSEILFPSGILNGNPKKHSIFGNKTDSGITPPIANRLILSDNEFNRGWSPLYGLMPEIKCGTDFCIDQINNPTNYDFFRQIDYSAAPQPFSVRVPANGEVCSNFAATGMSFENCNLHSEDNELELRFNPMNGCSAFKNDICRSPETIGQFTVGPRTYRVFLAGEKKYTSIQPIRFSLLPETIFTSANICSSYGTITPTGTIIPDVDCVVDSANSSIRVKAKNVSGTFAVDEASVSTITFTGGPRSVVMLPPDQRSNKSVLNAISDLTGFGQVPETFLMNEGSDNGSHDKPNEKRYGSLRQIRETFSSQGASMLFDHNVSCANLNGRESITMNKDGDTETYEVTIETVPGASTDPLTKRPLAYCAPSDPNAPAATCQATSNAGNFEKKMTIRKNGVLEEIIAFDCTQKAGRRESRNIEHAQTSFRREKEILYWNTEDSTKARFEVYRVDSEATDEVFSQINLREKSYSFEKVYKSDLTSVNGQVIRHSQHRDYQGNLTQSMEHTKFRLISSSGNRLSYANLNFYDDLSKNYFADPKYSSVWADDFSAPHFCHVFDFPFAPGTSCTSYPFVTGAQPVHGPASTSYLLLAPNNINPILNSGYFPVTGW